MEGTADNEQTKLTVFLEKLRRKESVDGIPDKLLGYEDADVLTLLHSFDKTVDEGRVSKEFFVSTINDMKKSGEETYHDAKKLKSSAAVDHHATDFLHDIGLFPIQLQDFQTCTRDMSVAKFEVRATAY